MKSDILGYITNRCTYDFGQGQNCPHPRSTASRLGYCHIHQRHQEFHETERAREVTLQLLAQPGGLANSDQVRATLANLTELISKNRIPQEKCGVLSYLCVSLLHSHERAEAIEAALERGAVVLDCASVAEIPSGEMASLPVHGELPCPVAGQNQQPAHDREVLAEVSLLSPPQHSAERPVIVKEDGEHGRVEEHDEGGDPRAESQDQTQRSAQLDDHRDPQQHGSHRQVPGLHVGNVPGPRSGLGDAAGQINVNDEQPPDQRPPAFRESFHEQLQKGTRAPT